MDLIINWKSWQRLFWHGSTKAVYVTLATVILAIYTISVLRLSFYGFILALTLVILSYGTFTDLVAHLFYDFYPQKISRNAYIYKIFHGRTHEICVWGR